MLAGGTVVFKSSCTAGPLVGPVVGTVFFKFPVVGTVVFKFPASELLFSSSPDLSVFGGFDLP